MLRVCAFIKYFIFVVFSLNLFAGSEKDFPWGNEHLVLFSQELRNKYSFNLSAEKGNLIEIEDVRNCFCEFMPKFEAKKFSKDSCKNCLNQIYSGLENSCYEGALSEVKDGYSIYEHTQLILLHLLNFYMKHFCDDFSMSEFYDLYDKYLQKFAYKLEPLGTGSERNLGYKELFQSRFSFFLCQKNRLDRSTLEECRSLSKKIEENLSLNLDFRKWMQKELQEAMKSKEEALRTLANDDMFYNLNPRFLEVNKKEIYGILDRVVFLRKPDNLKFFKFISVKNNKKSEPYVEINCFLSLEANNLDTSALTFYSYGTPCGFINKDSSIKLYESKCKRRVFGRGVVPQDGMSMEGDKTVYNPFNDKDLRPYSCLMQRKNLLEKQNLLQDLVNTQLKDGEVGSKSLKVFDRINSDKKSQELLLKLYIYSSNALLEKGLQNFVKKQEECFPEPKFLVYKDLKFVLLNADENAVEMEPAAVIEEEEPEEAVKGWIIEPMDKAYATVEMHREGVGVLVTETADDDLKITTLEEKKAEDTGAMKSEEDSEGEETKKTLKEGIIESEIIPEEEEVLVEFPEKVVKSKKMNGVEGSKDEVLEVTAESVEGTSETVSEDKEEGESSAEIFVLLNTDENAGEMEPAAVIEEEEPEEAVKEWIIEPMDKAYATVEMHREGVGVLVTETADDDLKITTLEEKKAEDTGAMKSEEDSEGEETKKTLKERIIKSEIIPEEEEVLGGVPEKVVKSKKMNGVEGSKDEVLEVTAESVEGTSETVSEDKEEGESSAEIFVLLNADENAVEMEPAAVIEEEEPEEAVKEWIIEPMDKSYATVEMHWEGIGVLVTETADDDLKITTLEEKKAEDTGAMKSEEDSEGEETKKTLKERIIKSEIIPEEEEVLGGVPEKVVKSKKMNGVEGSKDEVLEVTAESVEGTSETVSEDKEEGESSAEIFVLLNADENAVEMEPVAVIEEEEPEEAVKEWIIEPMDKSYATVEMHREGIGVLVTETADDDLKITTLEEKKAEDTGAMKSEEDSEGEETKKTLEERIIESEIIPEEEEVLVERPEKPVLSKKENWGETLKNKEFKLREESYDETLSTLELNTMQFLDSEVDYETKIHQVVQKLRSASHHFMGDSSILPEEDRDQLQTQSKKNVGTFEGVYKKKVKHERFGQAYKFQEASKSEEKGVITLEVGSKYQETQKYIKEKEVLKLQNNKLWIRHYDMVHLRGKVLLIKWCV